MCLLTLLRQMLPMCQLRLLIHVLFRVRALGRSQGPFCRLFLFVWPAQAQAAYAANVPQWAMAMPRRRLRDYLCT